MALENSPMYEEDKILNSLRFMRYNSNEQNTVTLYMWEMNHIK